MREFAADETCDTPSNTASDPLAPLDNLARQAIARAAPIRYEIAGSDAAREAIYRLRHRAVIERGWEAPHDLVDGLEREADDERATLIGGWNGAELVATARLIFPEPGRRLPVEAVYGLVVEPRGRVVHVDRVTVARAHSDHGSRVLHGLIGRCWLEMRAHRFVVGAGIDSPGMVRLYRRLGFEVTILGPAIRYWDEDRYPVRLDATSALSTIRARLAAAIDHDDLRE